MKDIDHIYPLTIVSDRYDGTYSGGKYLALNSWPEDVSEDIHGSDLECRDFWIKVSKNPKFIVGKGETVQEAYDDLKENIIKYWKKNWRKIND